MTNPDECRCADLVARLFFLLDAELDEAEAQRLRRHIAHCPECSDAAEAETHIREVLRRSCRVAAPDRLRTRVVTQITVLRTREIAVEGTEFV